MFFANWRHSRRIRKFFAQHRQLQTYATALRNAWEYQEEVKKDLVKKSDWEADYLLEIEHLSSLITGYEVNVENLRTRLMCVEGGSSKSAASAKDGSRSGELLERIASALGKKRRALCISSRGKAAAFSSVFERRGITRHDFDSFFDEELLDGKQSNLNLYLAQKAKSYAFVLYASDGLRHLSESNRRTRNLFPGAGPNDAVRKFLIKIQAAQVDSAFHSEDRMAFDVGLGSSINLTTMARGSRGLRHVTPNALFAATGASP